MICLHCRSIIIPICKLDEAYRGGFQQYKVDFPDTIERARSLGGLDRDLLCISVMNPMDADVIVRELESYGLRETKKVLGVRYCQDFCVYDIVNGLEYRCKWLVEYGYLAAYLHKKSDYFKVMADLCEAFRQRQAQVSKNVFNVRLKEINTALNSPMEINGKLNERNLFLTDKVTGQECEVVKSSIVGRDREDALWKTMVPVYEDLAKSGNGEAYNLLGIIFQEDKDLADKYFSEGMVNGSAYAAFNLAIRTEDKKEKLALFLWASEHIMSTDKQDNMFRGALFENLAKMYHLGIGTWPDRNEAERWYRAAIANHAKDKSVEDNFVVLLYENGKKLEALQQIAKTREEICKRMGGCHPDKVDGNYDRIGYLGVAEQTIRLSLITDTYMNSIACFKGKDDVDNLDKLLYGLPDLTLDKRFVLDDFRPRESTNSVLRIYARNRAHSRPSDKDFKYLYKKSVEPLSIFQFITLPFTEEAIWQAFLLSQTHHLMGMRWHGGYEERAFIIIEKDIAELRLPFSQPDCLLRLKEQIERIWNPDLCASVSLYDDYAIITHCWFNAWKGLSSVRWRIDYDSRYHRIKKVQLENETLLLKYHCGVWF